MGEITRRLYGWEILTKEKKLQNLFSQERWSMPIDLITRDRNDTYCIIEVKSTIKGSHIGLRKAISDLTEKTNGFHQLFPSIPVKRVLAFVTLTAKKRIYSELKETLSKKGYTVIELRPRLEFESLHVRAYKLSQEGKSYTEIAEALGVKRKRVPSLVYRGRNLESYLKRCREWNKKARATVVTRRI